MGIGRKFTKKKFIVGNLFFALIFVNALLFSGRLRAGADFTVGFEGGFGLAWLAFIIIGLIEIRKPGATMDERQASHLSRASSFAFWVTVLAACVLQVLLRSEAVGLALEAKDALAIVANLGLASLGLSWFLFSRRG